MNCVKKIISGIISSPTSKRTLAWIVAASLAFGGLTSTSFAENTDSSATESSQEIEIIDGGEDGTEDSDSDDATDSSSEATSVEDEAAEDETTDTDDSEIVIIDASEDDSTEDASDIASSETSEDEAVVIEDEDEKKVTDEATDGISADKEDTVEVMVDKTFTYTGKAQTLQPTDVSVKIGATVISDSTAYTLENNTQTNAGTYTVNLKFDHTKEAYKDYPDTTFDWTIDPMELTSVVMDFSYAAVYGSSESTIANAVLKTAVTNKKITIKSGDTVIDPIYDATNKAYFPQLVLEDSTGALVDASVTPEVGTYAVTVDVDSLKPNYTLEEKNITKGKFTIKENSSTTADVVIASSFKYGDEVKATLKSSTYTSANWELKKGKTSGTATPVKSGTGVTISTQASLSLGAELESNADGESYFLTVVFSNSTSKKTITKQFKVQSSLSEATVTDPDGTEFKHDYTGSEITQNIKVTIGSTELVKDTDYTVTSGLLKATAPGTYPVTLTGKGAYAGTKSFSWSIVEKQGPVTVTVNKTFTYNGQSQSPTVSDITVKVDGETITDKSDYTFSADPETNAGDYTATLKMDATKYPHITDTVKVPWSIKPMPINVAIKKGHGQTITYGKTGDELAQKYTKSFKSNGWITITNADDNNEKIKVSSLDGFALAIADTDLEPVAGDEKLPVGKYKIIVDEESLDTNYQLEEVTNPGSLTVTGKGSGTVTVDESYTYGSIVSAKIYSTDYTSAGYELKRGETEDSADVISEDTDIDNNSTTSISKTLQFKSLDANSEGQHYFLKVVFSDLASSKDAEEYAETVTVTKQFDVKMVSIADATAVTGKITTTSSSSSSSSGSSVTWKKDGNFTATVKYTTSQIYPTISSLTLNGKTLTAGTHFTVEGDGSSNAHSGSTSDQEFTIKLTGKSSAGYGGELTLKWVIQGSNNSTSGSATQNDPKLTGNGSVTAVSKSSRLDTLATTWQNQNPNKRKVYTINVTSIDRSNISDQAEDIISGLRDTSVVVECYDITVNEKVSSSSGTLESDRNVTEFDTPIDVALTLGKANTSKNLIVIREHGSETVEMVRLDKIPTNSSTEGYLVSNGKVTIYSKYFSNFTLVYTSNSSGASISGGEGPDDSGVNGSRAPRTGDNLPVLWVWVLVLFAGVILTSLAAYESLKARKVKAPVENKKKR